MDVEYWPFMANLFIGLFSVIPVIFALWFFKAASPSHAKVLILGIVLVAWAATIFYWLSGGLTLMEASVARNAQEQLLKDSMISSIKLWVFVFPAVTLAIGANLLTAYILARKNT